MKNLSVSLTLALLSNLALIASANADNCITVRREIRGNGIVKVITAKLTGISAYGRHDLRDPEWGRDPKKAVVTIEETKYSGALVDGVVKETKKQSKSTHNSLYPGESQNKLEQEALTVAEKPTDVRYLDSIYAVEFPQGQVSDSLIVKGQSISIQKANVPGLGGFPLDGKHVAADELIRVLDSFESMSAE